MADTISVPTPVGADDKLRSTTSGPRLIGQLVADAKLKKDEAQAVAMLASLAEKGRPLLLAATAAGLAYDQARVLALRFNIEFKLSGEPA